MVTEEKQIHQIMDTLGHQTRRDILALLKESAMPVGDLADRLPISRPAVSKHLRLLETAGLVEHRPSGTRNIFRLRPHGFDAARAYLESFWDEALEDFQRVAEHQAEPER